MKLKRVLALPFTMVADVVTLGNMGAERSFTQQVFDSEQREQRMKEELEILKAFSKLIKVDTTK